MNPENGGQSSSELQRQAAAAIARKKVLAAYAESAKKASLDASKTKTENQPRMKDEPVTRKIDSESWKRYHSEWQDYYQKYYSEYYSNAAKNYIAKERLKDAREQAEEEEILHALAHSSPKTEPGLDIGGDSIRDELRQKIRKKATKSVKKSRRMKRYIPIFLGVGVVLIILFLQYNRLIFAPIMAYMSPGNVPASQIEALDPTITQTVSADPRLIIPKLNVDVPVHFGIDSSEAMSAMNNGVAHYRISGASAYPGEIGNLVITGHSAGDVYSSNPYKYIFSGLERLENGDLIYVNYESVRYTYKVVDRDVVEPTNVASLQIQTTKPMITLVTCTPLGTSRYRLLIFGEQISPSYDGAESAATPDPNATQTENTEMPSNEPGFFEGIWNFLTGN